MSSEIVTLKASGLYTFYQSLMEVPPGALLKANNTVINRDGVIEPRRGIKTYGSSFGNINGTSRAKELFEYKGRILRHVEDKLAFDDGTSTFFDFAGSYLEPSSGYRIKACEAKQNIYFTTSKGIKKISATTSSEFSTSSNYITDSGIPRGISGTSTVLYNSVGFFPENLSTVSKNYVNYRIVWSLVDKNKNLLLGAPSDIMTVENPLSNNLSYIQAQVKLVFPIPTNIIQYNSTEYKYRIYRSEIANSIPSDELKLVYENNVTSAELLAGEIVYNDNVPELNRLGGVALYTNEISGEGILKQNDEPPLAHDIASFKGHLFYSNTRSKHSLTLEALNFSTLNLTYSNTITITPNGGVGTTYAFEGSNGTSVPHGSFRLTFGAGTTFTSYETPYTIYSPSNERVYTMIIVNTSLSPVTGLYPDDGRIYMYVNIVNGDTGATIAGKVNTALNNTDVNTAFSLDFTKVLSTNQLTFTATRSGVYSNQNTTAGITYTNLVTPRGDDVANKKPLLANSTISISSLTTTLGNTTITGFTSQNINAVNIGDVVGGSNILYNCKVVSKGSNSIVVSIAPTSTLSGTATLTFNSSPDSQLEKSIKSLVKIINENPNEVVTAYYVSGGKFILQSKTLDDISFSVSGSTFIASNFTPQLGTGATATTKVVSSADRIKNRLYFSKYQEPEAVPLINYIDIGAGDAEIYRIISLRESLFIFKEDGVYRLAGDPGPRPTWDVGAFDLTCTIKAQETAITLGNQCYFLSNQGVMRLNESSLESISRPIDNKLLPLFSLDPIRFLVPTISFSVSYESDKSFMLWTAKNKNDQFATICYRYNTVTGAWTEWEISKTCAVLNSHEDVLYFGSGIDNYIEVERKTLTRYDYADREIVSSLPSFGISGTILKPSNFINLSIGDVITQNQYVTIYQFNSLLRKLDLDNGLIAYHGFYENLKMEIGDSLNEKMQALVARLNAADPITGYSFSGSTVFETIQTEFNVIINKLNISAKTYFDNYNLSQGTVRQEAIIINIDTLKKQVETNSAPSFMEGGLVVFKGIPTNIEYAPQHNGDATSFKQFSSATFMFERRSFTLSEMAYNSDISDNYEIVKSVTTSSSNFGNSKWGADSVWGGLGDQGEIRTLIPLKKQRCRFLGCKFSHVVALETFQLYGLSLSVRSYTIVDRDYR